MNKCRGLLIGFGNVPPLRSLASGLAASENDGINCDVTGKVGSDIQGSLNIVYVRQVSNHDKEASDGAHPAMDE